MAVTRHSAYASRDGVHIVTTYAAGVDTAMAAVMIADALHEQGFRVRLWSTCSPSRGISPFWDGRVKRVGASSLPKNECVIVIGIEPGRLPTPGPAWICVAMGFIYRATTAAALIKYRRIVTTSDDCAARVTAMGARPALCWWAANVSPRPVRRIPPRGPVSLSVWMDSLTLKIYRSNPAALFHKLLTLQGIKSINVVRWTGYNRAGRHLVRQLAQSHGPRFRDCRFDSVEAGLAVVAATDLMLDPRPSDSVGMQVAYGAALGVPVLVADAPTNKKTINATRAGWVLGADGNGLYQFPEAVANIIVSGYLGAEAISPRWASRPPVWRRFAEFWVWAVNSANSVTGKD